MKNVVLVLFAVAVLSVPALADTTWVTVGSPFRQNAIPFWGQSYDAMRMQLLYLQSEINQAGRIAAFGLNSCGDAPGEFYKVKVKLCHTPVTTLDSAFNDNYGGNTPVEILAADTLLVNTGPSGSWYTLPAAFDYNNTDNLLLEITWRGDNGQTVRLWRNVNGDLRRCVAYDDTAKQGAPDDVNAYYARIGFIPVGIQAAPEPQLPATRLQVAPAVSRSRFRSSLPGLASGTAQVISADGRRLWQLPVRRGEAVWDATDAPAGVYLCRIGSETATLTVVR